MSDIKHELFKFVDYVIDNHDPNQLMEAYDTYVMDKLSDTESNHTMKELLVTLYNYGYCNGHNDTVEGVFGDVHHTEMHTENADIVDEILEDLKE